MGPWLLNECKPCWVGDSQHALPKRTLNLTSNLRVPPWSKKVGGQRWLGWFYGRFVSVGGRNVSSWAEAPGMLGLDQGVAGPHMWVPVLTVGTGVSAGGNLEGCG